MPESLASVQKAFAAHIRNPAGVPAPAGIEERRMQIYRELFFNNISSLLAGNFPVLRSLYDPAGWARLMRGFYMSTARRRHISPNCRENSFAILKRNVRIARMTRHFCWSWRITSGWNWRSRSIPGFWKKFLQTETLIC